MFLTSLFSTSGKRRGNGCATEYPGVYSRVSYQFGWIKGLVCEISNDPPNYFGCPADVGANNEQEPVTTPAPVSGARPSSSVVTPSPAPTPAGYLPIRVDVQLDLKSSDTGWALMSEDGEVIAEVEPGQYTNPYELTQTMVYLPPLTQFSFVIKDTAGDGKYSTV